MDFITDLPISWGKDDNIYNTLLIIIDSYIKIAKYIPYRKTTIIKELTNIFLKNIIRRYNTLNNNIIN
jgi:hypothetical protein